MPVFDRDRRFGHQGDFMTRRASIAIHASSTVEIHELARVLRASGKFGVTVLPDGESLVVHQTPRNLAQDQADFLSESQR